MKLRLLIVFAFTLLSVLVKINAQPLPTGHFLIQNISKCAGSTPVATTLTSSQINPNFIFLWSTGDNTSTTTTFQNSLAVDIHDIVWCRITLNGQSVTDTMHVTSKKTPIPSITQLTPSGCVDSIVYLSAAIGTNAIDSIQWVLQGPSGFIPFTNNQNVFVAHNSGTYGTIVKNSNGCENYTNVVAEVLHTPKKYLHDTTYCQTIGQPNFSIVDNQNSYCTYLWNQGNTGDEWVINPNSYMAGVGHAWVTITDTNGCTTKDTISWQAWNLPNPLLNSGIYTCNGTPVTLYDSSVNIYNHTWTYGGTYIGSGNSVIVTQSGTYHVHTTTEHGCSADNDVFVLQSESVDVSGFNFVPQTPYENRSFYFHALDVDNATECLWDFGDGSTSNQISPIHTFSGADSSLITLTVSNPNYNDDCKSKTVSQMISTIKRNQPTTGLNDLGEPSGPIIYPNPAIGIIHVVCSGFIAASVMNINGTIIKVSKTKDIDVSVLSNGIYVLKIETNKGKYYKKIIKEK